MISKALLERAKKLTFLKMWENHPDNFEEVLSIMTERIQNDENGFILAFQKCKNLNFKYIMRDVLYLVYETKVNSHKNLKLAAWLEAADLNRERKKAKRLETGKNEKALEDVGALKNYIDDEEIDYFALYKKDIFESHKEGKILYGFLMRIFTECMEHYNPSCNVPFIAYFQVRLNHLKGDYKDFDEKLKITDYAMKLFSELGEECDNMMNETELRKSEIQYFADRLVRFRDLIDEAIDFFGSTKQMVELKKMQSIKKLIDLHTTRIVQDKFGDKYKKLTAKEVMKSLGRTNSKGVFKPMDNERFRNLLSDAYKMWNAVAMYTKKITLEQTKKQQVHYKEIIAEVSGHFTAEFASSIWLDKWNKELGTAIQS